jgi:probable addiction module antidote protein
LIARFEIADHLKNETVIAEYLSLAAQDKNPDVLMMALSDVAKARGMTQVATDAGPGRVSRLTKPCAKVQSGGLKPLRLLCGL